jgi:hypothetical protein
MPYCSVKSIAIRIFFEFAICNKLLELELELEPEDVVVTVDGGTTTKAEHDDINVSADSKTEIIIVITTAIIEEEVVLVVFVIVQGQFI